MCGLSPENIAAAVRAALLLNLEVPDSLAPTLTASTDAVVKALGGDVDAVEPESAAALLEIHNILRDAACETDRTAMTLRHAADTLGTLLLRREADATDARLEARIEQRARELVDVRFADTDTMLN